MASDLSTLLDFMEDIDNDGGFDTPLMPSTKFPEGKKYRVPSPDAATGLRLAALADVTLKASQGGDLNERDARRLKLDDEEERDFIAQVLSQPCVDEMTSDGVKYEHMKRISQYAFLWFGVSREAAESAVERGLLAGKVLPLNRAQRRASTKGSSTSSGSGASKKTTRSS